MGVQRYATSAVLMTFNEITNNTVRSIVASQNCTIMPRNQNIFTDAPLWSHPKDNKQYFTVEEVPQALRELGIQHLHVDSASSTIKLVQKNWQRFQGGRHRRHLCYFSSDKRGSCKFAIRETCYDTQNGNSCFQVGNCVHGAHLTNRRSKLPQFTFLQHRKFEYILIQTSSSWERGRPIIVAHNLCFRLNCERSHHRPFVSRE